MSEEFLNQAAVLLAISKRADGAEQILLTLRAEHLASHSGEVCFPGGMWEKEDPDLCTTALREANEEVGLNPSAVEVFAELKPSYTGAGTRVTPFVGRVCASQSLYANPAELQDLFWLPLEVLRSDLRVRTDIFKMGGAEYWAPVYEYAGYTIWGFTARVLVEFMAREYGLVLQRRHHSAPEVLFKKS
ncbi:NTP pyrophosphohydrolases including oxidative damage repair enzymes [Alteromonadaceae bacterium Bs31]|nr:NTP pyrophosphohydrolases including oxidative damage repair enzymes [Alteromonadaceae bacterium Bs31]